MSGGSSAVLKAIQRARRVIWVERPFKTTEKTANTVSCSVSNVNTVSDLDKHRDALTNALSTMIRSLLYVLLPR